MKNLLVVIAGLAILTSQAIANIDSFLTVTGSHGAIASESQTNRLANGIEIESWDLALPNLEAGPTLRTIDHHGFLTIVLKQGTSYAQLMNEYMTKGVLPVVTLTIYKSVGQAGSTAAFKFQTFTIKNATISNMSGTSDDEALKGTVVFSFTNLAMEYIPQNPDGSGGKPVGSSWILP